MHTTKPRRRSRLRASTLQPLLNLVARRNRKARELTTAMRQLRCAACGSSLAAHVKTTNRWIGCRRSTGGAR